MNRDRHLPKVEAYQVSRYPQQEKGLYKAIIKAFAMAGKTEEHQAGLTVSKEKDFSEWYTQVVQKAELADYSPVKGCMIIRPYGYSIWQKIQEFFDSRIQKMGVRNAYFPLFIPESFFKKEAEHAEGFAPEVAWVERKSESEDRYALRPTSETIIYDAYSRWIRSWRDLPLRLNQWCNIIRWEVKDVKLFIRSREFLWQEGHCVYETREECDKETFQILDEYEKVSHELLAVPVIKGKKTEHEKFAGAMFTTTIESLMPDGKALQMGTSHTLSQGFAKGFDIKFLGKDEKYHAPWQNSWGISTRLIGASVMTHSDNKGLILPPKIAKNKVVIVPIIFEKAKTEILKQAKKIKEQLKEFAVILDDREDYSPGWKFSGWELKGIPLRIEIGPKDLEKNSVTIVKRNTGEKSQLKIKDLEKKIPKLLDEIHNELFENAKKFLESNIIEAKNWNEFANGIKNKKIIKTEFCNETSCENSIKEKTGASSRCIPLNSKKISGKCFSCGKPAKTEIYFARSY